MAKATAKTKARAKAKGIKLTKKKGSTRVARTEAELKNALKRFTKKPIPKWGKEKTKTAARVLGSKGGRATARKKKK
jgi:hypothetical protein